MLSAIRHSGAGLASLGEPRHPASRARVAALRVRATAVAFEVPSMEKRKTLNLMLLGAIGLPISYMSYGFFSMLAAPSSGCERQAPALFRFV